MSPPVRFRYLNWRGETSMRLVQPIHIHFGVTSWHPFPQWLMRALDLKKGEERDFALSDCDFTAATVTESKASIAQIEAMHGPLMDQLAALMTQVGDLPEKLRETFVDGYVACARGAGIYQVGATVAVAYSVAAQALPDPSQPIREPAASAILNDLSPLMDGDE